MSHSSAGMFASTQTDRQTAFEWQASNKQTSKHFACSIGKLVQCTCPEPIVLKAREWESERGGSRLCLPFLEHPRHAHVSAFTLSRVDTSCSLARASFKDNAQTLLDNVHSTLHQCQALATVRHRTLPPNTACLGAWRQRGRERERCYVEVASPFPLHQRTRKMHHRWPIH